MKAQECTTTKCNQCGEMKPRSEYYQNRKTRKCKQCEAKASHQRYLRNREKVLRRGAKRRAEKSDEIKQYLADWYVKNRKHVLARCREYNKRPEVKARERKRQSARYAARREAIQAARKAYYKANPEAKRRFNEYLKRHYRENPGMYAARCVKRRTARDKATPSWADANEINRIYKMATEITRKTGIQHHVDHIVPLQGRNVCGLHVEYNLQVIPAKDNLQKSNRLKI